MPKILKTPDFKNEAEEALWWESNQELLHQEFTEAIADGTVGRGTAARGGVTPAITIRLDPKDLELARLQAEERGLRYQTYLKMVIHQALLEKAASKA